MNVEAVQVHVASVAEGVTLAPQPARPPRRRRTVFTVVTLTADDPAQQILPASTDRLRALVQALDADITVSDNQSAAAAGAGATVPKANTAPWPVEHDGPVYAAAQLTGSATARVSVTAVYGE